MLMAVVGCDFIPPRPPVGRSGAEDGSTRAAGVADDELVRSTASQSPEEEMSELNVTGPPVDEFWEKYLVGGKKVGFSHTKIETLAEPVDGFPWLVTFEDRLQVQRSGDALKQRFLQKSLESPRGEVLKFWSDLEVGDQQTRYRGEVVDGRMTIDTRQSDQVQRQVYPWPKDALGSFAVSRSLRQQPMRPGETRTLTSLLPIQYVPGRIELTASARVPVPVGDSSTQRLLEIESVTYLGDAEMMRQTLWADEDGNVLKSYTAAFDLTSVRSSQQDATLETGELVDLLAASRVQLDEPIPAQQDQVRLRVRHGSRSPAEIIPTTEYQQVIPENDKTAEIIIHRTPQRQGQPPRPEDRQPSPFIQSNDARIVKLAQTVAQGGQGRLVTMLRDVTHGNITQKNFTQGFASAAEVIRNPEGDCTEHAVLLAALLRASGIPAKVAAGLVQTETEEGPAMAYHMWTLAWDEERWVVLDAMFGDVPVGTDRIEILRTSLSDGNQYSALMPVLQMIGQVSIEVLPADESVRR